MPETIALFCQFLEQWPRIKRQGFQELWTLPEGTPFDRDSVKTRIPQIASPELDIKRTPWLAVKSNVKCNFSVCTFFGEKHLFKSWSDIFWGILLLMLLPVPSFCQKSSRFFFFHQEGIKYIFLHSAYSVCHWEFLVQCFLIPKPLKWAESTSTKTWFWPRSLYSWNINEREKIPINFSQAIPD